MMGTWRYDNTDGSGGSDSDNQGSNGSGEYTIQKNDTLTKISTKFGITNEEIVDANKGNKSIANQNLIFEGGKLNIPGEKKSEPVKEANKEVDTARKADETTKDTKKGGTPPPTDSNNTQGRGKEKVSKVVDTAGKIISLTDNVIAGAAGVFKVLGEERFPIYESAASKNFPMKIGQIAKSNVSIRGLGIETLESKAWNTRAKMFSKWSNPLFGLSLGIGAVDAVVWGMQEKSLAKGIYRGVRNTVSTIAGFGFGSLVAGSGMFGTGGVGTILAVGCGIAAGTTASKAFEWGFDKFEKDVLRW